MSCPWKRAWRPRLGFSKAHSQALPIPVDTHPSAPGAGRGLRLMRSVCMCAAPQMPTLTPKPRGDGIWRWAPGRLCGWSPHERGQCPYRGCGERPAPSTPRGPRPCQRPALRSPTASLRGRQLTRYQHCPRRPPGLPDAATSNHEHSLCSPIFMPKLAHPSGRAVKSAIGTCGARPAFLTCCRAWSIYSGCFHGRDWLRVRTLSSVPGRPRSPRCARAWSSSRPPRARLGAT